MAVNGFVLLFIFCGYFSTSIYSSYTTIPGQFKKCAKPSIPYSKQPVGEICVEMKNGHIKGNLTIVKEIGLQGTLQDFYYEDGKWQQSFYLKNMNCRISLIAALSRIFGINYNKKSCSVPKGVYFFDVDYNVFDRFWVGTRYPGRMMKRFEVLTKLGTLWCYELECKVVQKKD